MAEHAVGNRTGTPASTSQVGHPSPAEECHSDGPLRITEYGNRKAGLRAAGEIDLNSHEIWEQALRRVAGQGEVVHLDLSELTFIDVHGTTLLVNIAAALPEEYGIVVHDAPAGLYRVMQVLWPDEATAITFKGEQ